MSNRKYWIKLLGPPHEYVWDGKSFRPLTEAKPEVYAAVYEKDSAMHLALSLQPRLPECLRNREIKILPKYWKDEETKNKYGAVSFWYDPQIDTKFAYKANERCIHFDSKLEFSVYQFLRKEIKPYRLRIHFPVEIVPGEQERKAITWKCDFIVNACPPEQGCKHWFIEAKGEVLPSFKMQMRLMQRFNPEDFKRVIVVGEKWEPIIEGLEKVDMETFKKWARKELTEF